MPLPFYLTCLAILGASLFAWNLRRAAWGLPACMVLGTVAIWYVGDVLYNDLDLYLIKIGPSSIESAWWQVLWFVVGFSVLVIPINRSINGRLPNSRSHVFTFFESNRLRQPQIQQRIDVAAKALLTVWLILMGIALLRVNGNVIGLFAPYLGQKVDPWARGQIGGGFSAFISLAAYLQLFLAAAFGVFAALAINPKTRRIALLICALTLPYYIFDRTRSNMLATVLPGVLAYIFLRLQGGIFKKVSLLAIVFLIVNFWFTFVVANRGQQSIARAFETGGNAEAMTTTRHLGLNMFEELAWIDKFIETGFYMPNQGQRYFAELVNPIPRALWKNKPTIGLDYAVARGQAVRGPKGEVTATISTGMIGQGVVNFGRVGGPLAAAILMALWVALLARQDLMGSDPSRLILYMTGMLLTFNLGRDITLLVLYPFFFGLGLYLMWKRFRHEPGGTSHRRVPVPRGSPEGTHAASHSTLNSENP